MTLLLQTTASQWATQAGASAALTGLQQDAADPAENGSTEADAFSLAMTQSQAVQQQLQLQGTDSSSAETLTGERSQAPAVSGTGTGNSSNSDSAESSSEQAQKFLDGLMEQLLANRLGINKKEMDRLKEKIAELELKRKALADQMNKGGNDQNLSTAIRQIDQQITALEKQLQQLVRENELSKNNPDDDKRREWSAQSLGQSV